MTAWLTVQRGSDCVLAVNLEKVTAIEVNPRLVVLRLDNGGLVFIETDQGRREQLLRLIHDHTTVSLPGVTRADIVSGG